MASGLQRGLGEDQGKRVQLRVEALDALELGRRYLYGRELAGAQPRRQLSQAQVGKLGLGHGHGA